jgi:hypothetical protein
MASLYGIAQALSLEIMSPSVLPKDVNGSTSPPSITADVSTASGRDARLSGVFAPKKNHIKQNVA